MLGYLGCRNQRRIGKIVVEQNMRGMERVMVWRTCMYDTVCNT